VSQHERRRVGALGALCVLLATERAHAHLVTTGLGPIYDGVSHVLMSPEDLVPILAMSLLAGMNGARAGRRSLFAVSLAWLVGGAVGFLVGGAALPAAVTSLSFLVLGGLAAADRPLSQATVTSLAAVVGLLHGGMNGAAIVAAGREPLGLIGIGATVFVVAALTSGLVVSIRPAPLRIAVRVAGSWVAAIGLLMLGWSVRGAA
jgi:hydrogenase/urease accessory protein HupE